MPGLTCASPWFNCLHPRPEAEVRLICFPWCGGGSQYYARWGASFPPEIEVVGVRLPGRETRIKDDHVTDLSAVTAAISEDIIKYLDDKPFAFFGHSMGVILCYEAAVYIKEHYGTEPRHIYFSADYAPHSEIRCERAEDPDYRPLHEYTDTDLVERIGKLGGTPKLFMDNTDFMINTFLPPYRSDLKMIARYCRRLGTEIPLNCPITAIDGNRDVSHNLSEYVELTTNKVKQMTLPGGHFYLLKEENSKRLCDIISTSSLGVI